MKFNIDIKNSKKQKQLLSNNKASLNCSIHGDTATINNVYIKSKRIRDVFRYTLGFSPSTNTIGINCCVNGHGIGKFNDQPVCNSSNQKIVLLLESPHKDEYTNGVPTAPAQGTTGNNIAKYILNVLFSTNLKGTYDLIICNPVQFQASLYDIHGLDLNGKKSAPIKYIRNKAWEVIYSYEKRRFFIRLIKYNPSIIINACTAYRPKKNTLTLKESVTLELKQWKKSSDKNTIMMYEASEHPCAWTKNTSLTPI